MGRGGGREGYGKEGIEAKEGEKKGRRERRGGRKGSGEEGRMRRRTEEGKGRPRVGETREERK